LGTVEEAEVKYPRELERALMQVRRNNEFYKER
jgi:hypothetical protein